VASPASVGERVRVLRLARGLSQTDLARALTSGASDANGLVSKVENGRQPVDEPLVATMAAALGCTQEFLLRGAPDALVTRPWLRAYADAPAKTVESTSCDNMLVAEAVRLLQLKVVPDGIPLFDGDAHDDDEIERFAQHVRAAAGIADGAVVGNAMRAADRLGCVVLPLKSELGRHLGMSQRIDGVPFVRVARPGGGETGVPGDRQRFTVAHEIGHLGLHTGLPAPETAEQTRLLERQAHRFASAFLAPGDALMDDWESRGGRVTLSTLAELKATWGVAIRALVVRFQQLGVISGDQATSLYKQISKRGWNKAEPVHTTNEQPVWLTRALERRVGAAGPDAGPRAAGLLGLHRDQVVGWLDWSPVRSGEVLSFPTTRGSRMSAGGTGVGSVVDLRRPASRKLR
jgi:Zn-dependent peptidase ImmA (M78 family)/transcriptional regulator with XRE-family HTH domain